ncbi:DUF6221 family protein [Streptomyces neyagawaensis]|uniref:DUF6221 family protein n=1 Tax=Streptomyces neyagawaensis TaxID=42238 RepID=UPI0006E3CD0A|nr:DUF6221 family protein [Streptomyces neyagawaensis]MCL6734393.1 DUF6221 family protein [Streptomyces neyagawaensis]MDE1682022.1 DUF6221 family protein [Streptomyces neyagawaensis]
MDDLVQWLRAQLDQDERIARRAGGLAWSRPPEYLGDPAAIRDSEQERVVCYEGWPSEGQAVHIAEWDPARVLREIDAKRRIIDQHERYSAERRRMMGGWDPQSDDSPILAALAAVYADRPGYREEWRP